jgi:hypothetical protein
VVNLTTDFKNFGKEDVSLTTSILENIVGKKELLNEVV